MVSSLAEAKGWTTVSNIPHTTLKEGFDVMATAVAREEELYPWWLVLLQGIAMLILGALLLIKPGMTTVVVVQLVGIYWFVAGIFNIVSIFIDSERWGWKLIMGVLGIIAGIIVVQYPLWSTIVVDLTVIWFLGIGGIIMGLISLLMAFQGGGWGAGLLGLVSIIFGAILIANRFAAGLSLPWVIGIFAIVGGIASIFQAFRLR